MWRGAWLTERAPRDRSWLPAPSWCDGRRALSGTLLLGAQTARQSWSSGASRSRPSRLVPGPPHTTHKTWVGEGRHPELEPPRSSSNHQSDQKSSTTTKPPTTHEVRNHQKTHEVPPNWRLARPFITPFQRLAPPRFLLRPLPAPAGSFRKGAFLRSNASLLPVYRSALLPALAGMFPKGGVP